MSDLFLHLLNMSLTASWMILAVLLLRLVLKKAPRWIPCLLWGVVALRLILPFSLESALSLIPSAEPIPPDIAITDTPAVDTGIPVINETVNPIIHETFTPPAESTGATPIQTLLGVVSIVWVAGVGLMLLYSLFSYLRLYAKVRASLRREANVYYCDAIAYPFILGIFRPRIYVPSGMPEDQVGYILRHERAHLARRDHWWKPLGFLLLSVYWFNPIIWVGYILLCRDIEMACDEKVIKDMSGAAKVGYSEALVACSMQRRMILACPLAFGEVGVKQRIRSVLNYKKPAFWLLLTAIVASIAVAVCFLTDPKESDGLYGDVSAFKLTDAQAQELLADLVERQIELEFMFADEAPEADPSQPHPLDKNLWLSTDERFSSIQDIRDMVLGVMTREAAETLYFYYLDGPFDSIEDGPEFLEYEGKLYVNMYAGGKGFSTTYLFDTARIVERTRNSVTVEMNTQFVDTDHSFIYTPTLAKTKDGWRLDSSLSEGYDYESANELSLSVGEAPADSIRFTDTTVPEQNYTLLIQTSRTVTDLRLLALTDSDTISSNTLYRVQQTLYTLDTLTPEDTLALATYVNDATVNRAISYRDDKGVLRHYAIRCDMSGQKESPYLEELAFYEVEYDETSGSSTAIPENNYCVTYTQPMVDVSKAIKMPRCPLDEGYRQALQEMVGSLNWVDDALLDRGRQYDGHFCLDNGTKYYIDLTGRVLYDGSRVATFTNADLTTLDLLMRWNVSPSAVQATVTGEVLEWNNEGNYYLLKVIESDRNLGDTVKVSVKHLVGNAALKGTTIVVGYDGQPVEEDPTLIYALTVDWVDTYTLQDGEYRSGDFIYIKVDDGIKIVKCLSERSHIVLPAQLDGLSVVALGDYAFYQHTSALSITLPEGLKRINGSSFYRCYNLRRAVIPSTVTEIAANPFWRASSLPEIQVAAGNPAYKTVDGVLYDITGEMLISYPEGKMQESFYVPDYVKRIADDAFGYYPQLKKLYLTKSVELENAYSMVHTGDLHLFVYKNSPADRALQELEEAKDFYTYRDEITTTTDVDITPANCTHLYGQWTQQEAPTCNKDGTNLRQCIHCGTKETASVGRLEHLESDWIIDTVATTTQTGARHTECVYCRQVMHTDTIPKVETGHVHSGVQWIVTAYPGCTVNGSQSHICSCGATVTTATIPAVGHTVVTDSGVAATCTQFGLTEGSHCSVCNTVVTQQQTIAALGHSMKDETIAPTATAQGYTLHTCTTCGYAYKNNYTDPTGTVKTGLIYKSNPDGTCTVTGINGSIPEHLVIPQYGDSGKKVTAIGNRAFRNQTELKSITLPTTIRKIEEFAFYNCTGLTAVYGSEHITNVEISAFKDCTALTTIDLSGATIIDNYVLSGCSSLSDVTLSDQLKDLPQGMFTNCVALTAIHLPDSLTSIGIGAFQGSGIRQITIPNEVTALPMYAFRYCESLEKITFSKGLKSIAAGVFEQCHALSNIVFHEGLESIGRTAFLNCTALTNIRIPDSVNSIGDSCFSHCTGLTSAVLPQGLTTIPMRLFMDCKALKDITIPANVATIGQDAFSNTGLTEISLPGVVTIGNGAFYSCSELQSVDFGDRLTTIGGSAFSNCKSLKEAILTDSVTSIGMWAFSNCTDLQKVYLGNSLTDLDSAAFMGCTGLKTVFLPKSLLKMSIETYDQNPFTGCSGNLVLYSDIEKANTTLTHYFGLINYNVSYEEYLNIVNA